MANSSDVLTNQFIRELVGLEGYSWVVGGWHVHPGSHGQECTSYIIPEGMARDVGMMHAGFKVRELNYAALEEQVEVKPRQFTRLG